MSKKKKCYLVNIFNNLINASDNFSTQCLYYQCICDACDSYKNVVNYITVGFTKTMSSEFRTNQANTHTNNGVFQKPNP